MNLPPDQAKALASFPQALRDLVHAELAAGNSVVSIGPGHPAPWTGALLRLAKSVTTRPRQSDAVLTFYPRESADRSGEFTDRDKTFWVLEPPVPYVEPDMNAIREELAARERASNAVRRDK
jgi:hypothetical protein